VVGGDGVGGIIARVGGMGRVAAGVVNGFVGLE